MKVRCVKIVRIYPHCLLHVLVRNVSYLVELFQFFRLFLLFEVTFDVILGNGELKLLTEISLAIKLDSKSENTTTIGPRCEKNGTATEDS